MIDPVLLKPQLVALGNAKISGGAQQWGIPNTSLSAVGTSALVAGDLRYVPIFVRDYVKLTAFQLEITTGPASAANFRVGIYRADTELQPRGAPLFDSASISVALGFTGIKSQTGLTIELSPGTYLVALNVDVDMTIRTFISASPVVIAALGASPFCQRFSKTLAYAAFANPGTPWDTLNASNGGQQNFCVWQWTLL